MYNLDAKEMLLIGRAYRDGYQLKQNDNMAKTWLLRASDNGSTIATNELFDIYWKSAEDDSFMFSLIVPLAEKGDRGAMGRLARAFREGRGTKTDIDMAILWMKKATDAGSTWATNELFDLILNNNYDQYNLFELISPLAAKEDAGALGRLGKLYYLGRDVEPDVTKSIELLKKSAEKGVAWSANLLFDIMYKSEDHEYDDELVNVIMPFVDKGNVGSRKRLAKAYREGRGVELDLQKAAQYSK